MNRVGKSHLPLLAARPVRRFSGIFPLHGSAHGKRPSRLRLDGLFLSHNNSYVISLIFFNVGVIKQESRVYNGKKVTGIFNRKGRKAKRI